MNMRKRKKKKKKENRRKQCLLIHVTGGSIIVNQKIQNSIYSKENNFKTSQLSLSRENERFKENIMIGVIDR